MHIGVGGGQCWTCSVYIHFMHQKGWKMRFSKTVHTVLRGLMRSSAQSSELLLLYFSPVSAHLKHRMFSESKTKNRSRTLQKGEIWAMMESQKHTREAAVASVKVHSSITTLWHHCLSLSYTYTVPSITERGLTKEKRIIAKIKATT